MQFQAQQLLSCWPLVQAALCEPHKRRTTLYSRKWAQLCYFVTSSNKRMPANTVARTPLLQQQLQ